MKRQTSRSTIAVVTITMLALVAPPALFGQSPTADQIRRLGLQHHLDYTVPLADATFIGTHNSYSNIDDFMPSPAFANHLLGIDEQLRNGARILNLDIHRFAGIRMCHGSCLVAHGADFGYGLQQLDSWLSETANADEVVLLILEDLLDTDGDHDLALADIDAVFGGSVVYTPEDHFAMNNGQTCHDLPMQTLTKQDVRDAGRNVLIASFSLSDGGACELTGHDWRNSVWELPVLGAPKSSDGFDSTMKRYPHQWTVAAEDRCPGCVTSKDPYDASEITDALVRGSGVLALDFFVTQSRHEATIWSWEPGQPNNATDSCAVLNTTTGRDWIDVPCNSNVNRFACQNTTDGSWITPQGPGGTFSAGPAACRVFGSDYAFSVPVNATSN